MLFLFLHAKSIIKLKFHQSFPLTSTPFNPHLHQPHLFPLFHPFPSPPPPSPPPAKATIMNLASNSFPSHFLGTESSRYRDRRRGFCCWDSTDICRFFKYFTPIFCPTFGCRDQAHFLYIKRTKGGPTAPGLKIRTPSHTRSGQLSIKNIYMDQTVKNNF